MQIFQTINDLKPFVESIKNADQKIALVPTMGALHEGHMSLVKLARTNAHRVLVSIFVNPTQFNDNKDFEIYPRVLERDAGMLESVGVHGIFAPKSLDEIYGPHFQSWVTVEGLSKSYEGASRPGHFKGVSTVVNILFNIIRPDIAIFGEKDFQQLTIIERMVSDLKLGVEIIRAPIIREEGGLALSSRNARLSPKGKEQALAINRGLRVAEDAYKGGERRGAFLRSLVLETLSHESGVSPDYVCVVDEVTLQEVEGLTAPARILVAALVEGVRLIDNVKLG